MQLNPVITPQVAQPKPLVSPAVQAVIAPAVAAAQQTTSIQRTQTVQAPQATGKAENSRDTKSGTHSGQALDTQARATQARTNGTGYGLHQRGALLNVSV